MLSSNVSSSSRNEHSPVALIDVQTCENCPQRHDNEWGCPIVCRIYPNDITEFPKCLHAALIWRQSATTWLLASTSCVNMLTWCNEVFPEFPTFVTLADCSLSLHWFEGNEPGQCKWSHIAFKSPSVTFPKGRHQRVIVRLQHISISPIPCPQTRSQYSLTKRVHV